MTTATITHATGAFTPAAVEMYATTRETRNIFHTIIGRTSPVVTTAPAGLRTGTLKFLFDDQSAALVAEALLALPGEFTLVSMEMSALNMTFCPDDEITSERFEAGYDQFTIEVGFVEVDDD